jgi:quercetin dioxygenase-like cupin family protein
MVKIKKNYEDSSPEENEIIAILESEGLSTEVWSADAGTTITPQALDFARALIVVSGMIRITLPDSNEEFADLMAGDRIDLPPNTVHGIMVGPAGVKLVEGK